jgi:hypothetical protein
VCQWQGGDGGFVDHTLPKGDGGMTVGCFRQLAQTDQGGGGAAHGRCEEWAGARRGWVGSLEAV